MDDLTRYFATIQYLIDFISNQSPGFNAENLLTKITKSLDYLDCKNRCKRECIVL